MKLQGIHTVRALKAKGLTPLAAAVLLASTAAMAQVGTGNMTTTMGASPERGNPVLTPGATQLDTSGNYKDELRACNAGKTSEEKSLCIREARAAQAERKHGGLTSPSEQFKKNAGARCEVQKSAEDRAACQARVLGFGTVTGSIEGGGVLHEVETVVVPPGQTEVKVEPKTSAPVVMIPAQN